MSSCSRLWISDRLRIEVALPRHIEDDDVLFIHPKVTVREDRFSTLSGVMAGDTSAAPPLRDDVVVLDDVLPAPLRVPDGDKPQLLAGFGGLFGGTEVGSLVRNLITHKLMTHYSKGKSFTPYADPSVRLVAVVTAISVTRRDTTSTESHLIRTAPVPGGYQRVTLPPSSTKGEAISSHIDATEEMLRILEPLWSFKSNVRENTFRHSKSQQVPVTETFLKKLGFAAGSVTFTTSSTESQIGVQSTPSSQCGESLSDLDDEDDFAEHDVDIVGIQHRRHGMGGDEYVTTMPATPSSPSISMFDVGITATHRLLL